MGRAGTGAADTPPKKAGPRYPAVVLVDDEYPEKANVLWHITLTF
jgi:hypothetical protein